MLLPYRIRLYWKLLKLKFRRCDILKTVAKLVKGILGGMLVLFIACLATIIWISASLPKGTQWDAVNYYQHYSSMPVPRALVVILFILGFYSGSRR